MPDYYALALELVPSHSGPLVVSPESREREQNDRKTGLYNETAAEQQNIYGFREVPFTPKVDPAPPETPQSQAARYVAQVYTFQPNILHHKDVFDACKLLTPTRRESFLSFIKRNYVQHHSSMTYRKRGYKP